MPIAVMLMIVVSLWVVPPFSAGASPDQFAQYHPTTDPNKKQPSPSLQSPRPATSAPKSKPAMKSSSSSTSKTPSAKPSPRVTSRKPSNSPKLKGPSSSTSKTQQAKPTSRVASHKPANSGTTKSASPSSSHTRSVKSSPHRAGVSSTGSKAGEAGHSHSGPASPGAVSAQTSTAGHSHGSGIGHPSRRPDRYTSAGYAGDDAHLRPTRIPGLEMQSRGVPINTYLIPADPRTGKQNALAWWGAATILVDGAPHVIDLDDESKGLDTWKSANIKVKDDRPDYTISSYDKLDKDGLPELSIAVTRDPNDPNKWAPVKGPDGYPISKTALQYQGQYVDSSKVPGIAINQQMKDQNLQLGDPVYVHNTENGQGAWGIVMDFKGKDKKENTEVNVQMANQLGINSDPKKGGTSSQSLIYTAYPGAGKGENTKPEDWQPDAIKNARQTAAWDNGFDPSQIQWHLPQSQQPAAAPAPRTTPKKKPAPATKKAEPKPPPEEAPLPDELYMNK